MRKIIIPFTILCMVACNNAQVDSMKTVSDSSNTAAAKDTLSYAYKADYSSNFQIGDAKFSQIILDLWKAWETNTLSSKRSLFADSVTFYFANSAPVMGNTDSILAAVQKYRDQVSKMAVRIDAWTPLKSIDKNENWVCVWATEYDTQNGKMDSTFYQETWRFNQAGKADLVYQFASHPPSAPAKK